MATLIKIRTSGTGTPGGTIYSTLDDAVLNGVWPLWDTTKLLDDVLIYIQGGQAYGVDGLDNRTLGPALAPSAFGTKHMTIQTDPTEINNPGALLGRLQLPNAPGGGSILTIKKLKLYGTGNGPYGYGSEPGFNGFICRLEDCFIALKNSSPDTYFLRSPHDSKSGWIKGCTVVRTTNVTALTSVRLGLGNEISVNNSLILCHSASAVTVSVTAGTNVNKNNTVFNYGAGGISCAWANGTTIGDPNLATAAFIIATDENPATIIARDARLTAGSTLCLGTGDAATATATDIVGVTRG